MEMQFFKNIIPMSMAILLISCGSGNKNGNLAEGAQGNMDAYENSDVSAIEQARPQIVILPSDQTLKNFGAMTTSHDSNGRTYVLRNYQKYLTADDRCKRISSVLQRGFINQNFPITDLEQALKQIDTDEAIDMADGLEKDSKTQLLTAVRPDIIIELNYTTTRDKKINAMSHNYSNRGEKNISYTLNALDAYSNKVVATMEASNIKGESTTEAIQQDMTEKLPQLMADIQNYFSETLKRGRDIRVRVVTEKGCGINLSDSSIEGDSYADWIIDYIKSHTVKGAYKMDRNSDKELSFVNCRIKLLNADGTQYSAYDWGRDFAKGLRHDLGVKVSNSSQGLGEVVLIIKGLR